MIRKIFITGISLFLSLANLACATDAIWQGGQTPDVASLDQPSNWMSALPTGIATFDSTTTSYFNLNIDLQPNFTIGSFNFNHSASPFSFSFNSSQYLVFNAAGITGTNTNANIFANNAGNLSKPQVGFYSTSSSTSIGSASFNLVNLNPDGNTAIALNNAAQLVLADVDSSSAPVTSTDGFKITVTNTDLGQIVGINEAAQVLLKGQSFTGLTAPANNIFISATNSNVSAINATSDSAQLLIDATARNISFVVGTEAQFYFVNDSSYINSQTNLAGQLVVDGMQGSATFMAGDGAFFNLTNRNNGSIISVNGAKDAAQVLVNGNQGSASFSVGDGTFMYVQNMTGGAISGLGFDAGQMVFNAAKGSVSFDSGDDSFFVISNATGSTIESGIGGNDAAQLLVDGKGGTASFSIGEGTNLILFNDGAIHVDNPSSGLLVGQLVFDGSKAGAGGVTLTSGNSIIQAINGPDAVITSASTKPPAQMYFSNTTIQGTPLLAVLNQYAGPGLGPVEGIIFEGTSTANQAGIDLTNASLVVATNNALTIASLTGDETSVTKLYQSLVINTVAGNNTIFAGVIEDTSGINSLTISGTGTQVLTGANTYGGGTTISGGNLVVDGSIINDVLVNGGVLSGAGTIGSPSSITTVTSGKVKPGNSPGMLTNLGDYKQIGGQFQVDLNSVDNVPGINNGELVVDGTTTLAPTATLVVNSEDGSFYIGGRYTVLHSEGALSGTFAPEIITNTTLQPVVVYDGNNVYLDYQQAILECAFDRNGEAVAQQLFSITQPDYDQAALLMAFTQLDCPEIGAVLDEMCGAPYAELLYTAELSTHQFVRRLYDPLRLFLAKNLSCCDPECECDNGFTSWIEAGGMQSNYRAKRHRNAEGFGRRSGLRTNGYQISAGAQIDCDDTWVGGAALTYEHTENKFHHHCHGNTETLMGGVYGAVRFCDFYLLGDFVIGGNRSKLHRHFNVGELSYHFKSEPEALQGILYGEGGYSFRYRSFLLQPFLGLEGGYFSWKHVREHDGDALNLRFDKRNYGTFDTRLGIHLSMDEVCSGLFLGVDLAWQYRCTEINNFLEVSFIDFGNTFRVHGSHLDASSFDAAFNIEQKMEGNWSIYISGFWQQWSRSYAYDLLGGIAYHW